jgi:hypothetical protein
MAYLASNALISAWKTAAKPLTVRIPMKADSYSD